MNLLSTEGVIRNKTVFFYKQILFKLVLPKNRLSFLLELYFINNFSFWLKVQIDNDKCRRDREARLSGSRLELASLCAARGASRSGRNAIDSLGNSLSPLSPQSNNNSSPIENENKSIPITPTGKFYL